VESGQIQHFKQKFDQKKSEVLWSDTQDGDEVGLIGRETKSLHQTNDSQLKKSVKVLGCNASSLSDLNKQLRSKMTPNKHMTERKEETYGGTDFLGGGGIADFYERKVTSQEVYQ